MYQNFIFRYFSVSTCANYNFFTNSLQYFDMIPDMSKLQSKSFFSLDIFLMLCWVLCEFPEIFVIIVVCYILWKIGNTITIVATYTHTHMSCVLHTAQFLHTLTCSCGLARFSGSVSLWEKWLNNMRWWQYMASENQKSLKISWANGHLLCKDKKNYNLLLKLHMRGSNF